MGLGDEFDGVMLLKKMNFGGVVWCGVTEEESEKERVGVVKERDWEFGRILSEIVSFMFYERLRSNLNFWQLELFKILYYIIIIKKKYYKNTTIQWINKTLKNNDLNVENAL